MIVLCLLLSSVLILHVFIAKKDDAIERIPVYYAVVGCPLNGSCVSIGGASCRDRVGDIAHMHCEDDVTL